MTRLRTQPEAAFATDPFRQRLAQLGIPALSVSPDGQVTLIGEPSRVERLVLTSRLFASTVRSEGEALLGRMGQPCPIWPGLWLVPLPTDRQRRRRNSAHASSQPIQAAVLLGPELLESEQLQVICDAAELDLQATIAQVNPGKLLSGDQAQRLAAMLTWMLEDQTEIHRRYEELQTLSHQLSNSYEELSLLYTLSAGMSVDQPASQFLLQACRELREVVGLRWLALQLAEDDQGLDELAGQVFVEGPADWDQQMIKAIGRELMRNHPIDGEALIVDDTASLGVAKLPQLSRDLLVVALRRDEKSLGILFGGGKLDGQQIDSVDSKLCASLASSAAMFLENMCLYEDVQAMFMGTLHALTASIDAKDRYTFGHSERVALMSRMLAEAVGLEEHTVERVYIAGLVHDVGKIGVPEAVLCKPGKLTKEEFDLIKMHPGIGAQILKDIRQMQDLIPGVLYHHERWDGRGYPSGKSAEDIPLFGRLICLADSFDAMSSTRTYRQAMPREAVVEEIRRCAGSQFDPDLARVFVGLDFEPFFDLIKKHKQQSFVAGSVSPA